VGVIVNRILWLYLFISLVSTGVTIVGGNLLNMPFLTSVGLVDIALGIICAIIYYTLDDRANKRKSVNKDGTKHE
jgi:hypothetical protein